LAPVSISLELELPRIHLPRTPVNKPLNSTLPLRRIYRSSPPHQALPAGNNRYGVVICGVVICGVVICGVVGSSVVGSGVVVDGGGEGDAEDDAEDDDAEGEGTACLTTPGADVGVTGCCILIGTTR
jgi:hypothetical protein